MQALSAPKFSQLWQEETDELFRLAAAVPDGGTIVDIGTAQGGSAYVFHQATRGRQVSIYSYDPQPSREAYAHLAGTGVQVCAETSAEGAGRWGDRPNVDLLFIDGGHHLIDVVDDFNCWSPHLGPESTIAFHDYDSLERGGLIHLGVKVALDAILSQRVLTVTGRVGRLLSGTRSVSKTIEPADCLFALEVLVQRIQGLLQADYSHRVLLGQSGPLYEFMVACFGLEGAQRVDSIDAATPDAEIVVFRRPLGDVGRATKTWKSHSGPGVVIDNLAFCYLLETALLRHRSRILEVCQDRKAFFKWEEVLSTLDHSTGEKPSIEQRFSQLPRPASIGALSAFTAGEQVRLVILARMFFAITGYEL